MSSGWGVIGNLLRLFKSNRAICLLEWGHQGGREEDRGPFPVSAQNLERLLLLDRVCLGTSDLLTRHNSAILPASDLPSPLGLPPCPFAASAVGSRTWLSVPRSKVSGEPPPGLAGRGALWGRAQFLCTATEEHPPGTPVTGEQAFPPAYSLSPHSGFSYRLQTIHCPLQGAPTGRLALCEVPGKGI